MKKSNMFAAIAFTALIGSLTYLLSVDKVEAEVFTQPVVLAPAVIKPAPVDCMAIYNEAYNIMSFRQDGLPLDVMLTIYADSASSTALVKRSFRTSQYGLVKNQVQAAKEFAEREYIDCEDVQ